MSSAYRITMFGLLTVFSVVEQPVIIKTMRIRVQMYLLSIKYELNVLKM